jgi:uncharacterized membrane protein
VPCESVVVLAFDFLDVMAWDVALSALLLGLGSIALSYSSEGRSVKEEASGLRLGFAVAGGAAGFYLFLSGAVICFMWPFSIASGVYNILFGGVATLGGLLLLASSVALAKDVDLRPVSYFAAVVGVYAIVDAYAIVTFNLTNAPLLSALGYLSFAAPAILSVPALHFGTKRWRIVFALFAFLFAAAWLYQAANFTFAHLNPA